MTLLAQSVNCEYDFILPTRDLFAPKHKITGGGGLGQIIPHSIDRGEKWPECQPSSSRVR